MVDFALAGGNSVRKWCCSVLFIRVVILGVILRLVCGAKSVIFSVCACWCLVLFGVVGLCGEVWAVMYVAGGLCIDN